MPLAQAGGAGAASASVAGRTLQSGPSPCCCSSGRRRGGNARILRERSTNIGAWQSFLETRGSSGANEAGAEQAPALGAVREIEARNALTPLGINNVWFLGGKDTASQNVLLSLANWDHGESL